MAEEPRVKKFGEAVRGVEVKLVAVWSNGEITECARRADENSFSCSAKQTDRPATDFFERMGSLAREGYQTRVLYDSEEVVSRSEMGDVQSMFPNKI